LHAGLIAQLEAYLIEKARTCGKHLVDNDSTLNPRVQDRASVEAFSAQIEMMLQALGYDLFALLPVPQVTEYATAPNLEISAPLQSLFQAHACRCVKAGDVEFYSTHIPSFRAKVIKGQYSRVFALIVAQRNTLRLTLIGEQRQSYKSDTLVQVDEGLRQAIHQAHSQALSQFRIKPPEAADSRSFPQS